MALRNLCLMIVAAGFGMSAMATTEAEAGYYVRPIIDYEHGRIDGYVADGPTERGINFGTEYQSYVNLEQGIVKGYLRSEVPGIYSQAGGTFGDTVHFSTNAVGTTATFSFAYDGVVNVDPYTVINGADPRPSIGVFATLYVYKAGSGVTYERYGAADFNDWLVANVSDFKSVNINEDGVFNLVFDDIVSRSFEIEDTSYEIFTGLTFFALSGAYPVTIEMDFMSTGTFNIEVEEGVTFTSDSGVLLTGRTSTDPNDPTDVPLPASLLLFGPGLALLGWRRRR